jgi:AraC-like DNA-binding protein
VDPLSDVLRAVRLDGAYFYLVEATGPWAVAARAAEELKREVLPGAEHLISYHLLLEGECWGGPRDGPLMPMRAGDVILFPHGDPHLMGSSPRAIDDALVPESWPARYPETVRLGSGDGPASRLMCGFLAVDARPFNPLIAALPACIHAPGGALGWLASLPLQAVDEAQRPRAGSASMLTRLAELMFVEVLRQHVAGLPSAGTGWLAALRDPVVGRALTFFHDRPAHPWTLAEVAREAATSRTVLAERFTAIVGMPPMQYLTQWRLQLAAGQLARGGAKVAAVGARVGYESEAAFSRAFKRATGRSPADWRRQRQGAEPALSALP